jgi:phospholipid transport system substrate-binding protein
MTMASSLPTATIRLTRRSLVLATGVLALSPAAALAQTARDASAEQFVQAAAQKVLAILNQPATAQRSAVFDQAVEELVDLPKISNFVLGKYGRTITPAQRARFNTVFRRYAEGVYEKRLSDYRHASLKVVGSQVRKPGDVVVRTQLSGGPPGDPLIASWRVTQDDGAWKIIDLNSQGVWLAITQQQDFVSTIDNAGGDVGVLIGQLERDASRP